MLKLVIFNPVKEDAVFLASTLKKILLRARCSYELSTYYSADKIIQNISDNSYTYDILILKVPDQNSLLLAQKLRNKNLVASILFITDQEIPILSFLRYRPTGVISQITNEEHVFEEFKHAYIEQKSIDTSFTIKSKEKMVKINYHDIDYFENCQRVVTLHNQNGKEKIDFYAKFDDVYHSLPMELFVKCHQSFIVNMSRIKLIDKTNKLMILNSGLTICISKRLLSEVILAFEMYQNMS